MKKNSVVSFSLIQSSSCSAGVQSWETPNRLPSPHLQLVDSGPSAGHRDVPGPFFNMGPDEYITLKQAAELLDVPQGYVESLVKVGRWKSYQNGTRVRRSTVAAARRHRLKYLAGLREITIAGLGGKD